MAIERQPTDGELEILQVLWSKGPRSVQQVHEQIVHLRQTGYTSVLKTMQVMLEKGLLERDDSRRQHVYHAAIAEKQTKRHIARNLVDRVFAGSASNLVMHALSGRKSSAKELREIRQLLDELEEKRS
ncbi:MAG: BlaI/MecI/CopY family transcriptional regulator [Candidatus Sumerlaeaceae bacterium]